MLGPFAQAQFQEVKPGNKEKVILFTEVNKLLVAIFLMKMSPGPPSSVPMAPSSTNRG